MARKLKKDQKGQGAQYTTRARALRKLQLSLADFRRLCILKGIYPRDPKKKRYGKDQVYYHKKDLLHLAADGALLSALRDIKATNKKIRRSVGRKEHKDAKRRLRARPELPLQHLIKQKFPSLVDAIEDLDDCLCTTFLVAALPSDKTRGLPAESSLLSLQLSDQFLLLVSHIRALRKAFMSLKGFFFQAELLGRPVTWLIPHAFAQTVPEEVDCRVLQTFSLLYSSTLRLILFKLYKLEGLRYPPVVPQAALPAAAASQHLPCHKMQQAVGSFHLLKATKAPTLPAAAPLAAAARASGAEAAATNPKRQQRRKEKSQQKTTDATSAGGSGTDGARGREKEAETDEETEEGTAEEDEETEELSEEDGSGDEVPGNAPAKKPSKNAEEEEGEEATDGEKEAESDTEEEDQESDEEEEECSSDEEEEAGPSPEGEEEEKAAAAREAQAPPMKGCGVSEHPVQHLFDGLVFFLCRETPLLPLSFAIRSCGGLVGWQSGDSPIAIADCSITHQVVDRPPESVLRGGGDSQQREYVQPQWVFDCLNAGILLPTEDYGPGKALPPHLSPFVDDEAEGYIPHQRDVIAKLQKAHREAKGEDAEEDETDHDGPVEDPEASWRREREADVEAEVEGTTTAVSSVSANGRVVPSGKLRKEEAAEERLKHQKALMNKKHKRLLDRIEFGKQRKEQQAGVLRAKRKAIEQRQQP